MMTHPYYTFTGEWKGGKKDGKGTIRYYLPKQIRRTDETRRYGWTGYDNCTETNTDGSIFTGEVLPGNKMIEGTIVYPGGRKQQKILKGIPICIPVCSRTVPRLGTDHIIVTRIGPGRPSVHKGDN